MQFEVPMTINGRHVKSTGMLSTDDEDANTNS